MSAPKIVNSFLSILNRIIESIIWVQLFSSSQTKCYSRIPKFAIMFNVYELVNANTLETVNAIKDLIYEKTFDEKYILGFDGFFNSLGYACNSMQKTKRLEAYHYIIVIPNPIYGDKSITATMAIIKMCTVKNLKIIPYNDTMKYLI